VLFALGRPWSSSPYFCIPITWNYKHAPVLPAHSENVLTTLLRHQQPSFSSVYLQKHIYTNTNSKGNNYMFSLMAEIQSISLKGHIDIDKHRLKIEAMGWRCGSRSKVLA
jgi:hypothetical protein